jgi:hypothetical protein
MEVSAEQHIFRTNDEREIYNLIFASTSMLGSAERASNNTELHYEKNPKSEKENSCLLGSKRDRISIFRPQIFRNNE